MQRFAVIGLGRFGEHLARALTESGAEVIGIDGDASVVERLRDEVTLAVRLDGTDINALKSQGVAEVDAAIVGIGEDFESAALTVAALRELGVKRIVARAMTDMQGAILLKVGAHSIASAEKESALRWTNRLVMPLIERFVELGEDHSLVYLQAPAEFCSKSLLELDLRKKYGVNLVALRRRIPNENEGELETDMRIIAVPRPDTVVEEGDVLVVVGGNDNLSALPTE